MNKKTYLAPQMNEVHMAASFQICEPSDEVTSIGGNAELRYGGKSKGSPARSNDRRDDSEWGNLW